MKLNKKRMLASKVMKVGKNKVRFDPEKLEDINDVSFTRAAIRRLINDKAITKTKQKGQSKKGHKIKRSGAGSRKGSRGARVGKKEKWVRQVRALRTYLKGQKTTLDKKTYWVIYRKIKGGEIRTVKRLREYIGGKNI